MLGYPPPPGGGEPRWLTTQPAYPLGVGQRRGGGSPTTLKGWGLQPLKWFNTPRGHIPSGSRTRDRHIRHCQAVSALTQVDGLCFPFPGQQPSPLQHQTMVHSMWPTHTVIHRLTNHGQAIRKQT